MSQGKPLIDKKYLLQKFPGKGGWTYAEIPEVLKNNSNPFGWGQVSGSIDDFELKQYKLMPMGNGNLFLPVKAATRKKIGKEAGDWVHVILYEDDSIYLIPDEIIECFKYESKELYQTFLSFTEGERKTYIDWIYEAKTDETKVKRISEMMSCL